MTLRLALLLCLFFVALGLVFVRYTGAQYDEVLFVTPLYPPPVAEYIAQTPFGPLPLMVMTYVGAVKTWLFAPFLYWLGPSHLLIRLPMLLAAAGSILLFFLAMRRLVDPWVALLVTALLATDLNYLLMSLFDWGPVAIQHLLTTLVLYSAVRFIQEGGGRWLGLAAFAAGLMLWDKAISILLLGGFGVALLLVFPKPVWDFVRQPRRVALAFGAFLLGAAPLIYYNIVKPARTFTAQVESGGENFAVKISQIDKTLSGNGLFGYLTRPDAGPKPSDLRLYERAALKLEFLLGFPRHSLQGVLAALSLLAVPVLLFTSQRRLVAWIVLGLVITCVVMFNTRRAGVGLHHIILLWPMFHVLIAIAAARPFEWQPRLVAAFLLVIAGSNLIVANSMVADFARSGSTVGWTDALRPLMNRIGAYQGRKLVATEWGILEQVKFFSEGRIGFYPGSDGWIQQSANPDLVKSLHYVITHDDSIFVGHAPGSEVFADTNSKLVDMASALGYQKRILETVKDRHGRPVFEIFDFRR